MGITISKNMTETDQDLYDIIGEEYSLMVENSPYNAYYERPAMLSLIGDVSEKTILDLGAGSGIYAETFLKNNAKEVTGVEISQKMVDIFKQRLKGKAKIFRADISNGLDFLPNDYYDIINSSLVLHYIADWRLIFQHIATLLKPG